MQTKDWETDYCNSIPPNDLQEKQMKDAFDRIEKRGAACKKITQRGRHYLNKGLFRIYPGPGNNGGYGVAGSVILSDGWLNHYDNYSGGTKTDETPVKGGKVIHRNLDALLVHELDHVMDNGSPNDNQHHLDPAAGGYLTTNQKQCDGLAYPYP